jgi:4-hydroxythreonine-4-phosphate dehydrogenase
MRPLLVSSGEPAGVGPDLCLTLAGQDLPIVILCDKFMLAKRAKQLGLPIVLVDYQEGSQVATAPNQLTVLSIPCSADVVPGQLNPENSTYVLKILTAAAARCLSGEFSALVTAPVHKAVINQAGFEFTGHTEFFANYFNMSHVVMMLACPAMKVALITTHLPLRKVADAITEPLIITVITQLYIALQNDFGISNPKISVAGLNPHAGEGGYLGREEIDVITPALILLKNRGINVRGPMPADTMFTPHNTDACDAFVAMYHDQGLAVLKYAGFGRAVNITLGLPIIRTSVDHGTALELAGKGSADAGSLLAAVEMAAMVVKQRENLNDNN